MERYAVLNEGQTYRNRNGSDYVCKQVLPGTDGTILERTTDRWTLTAHGINLYEDGTIEWDYSTGGHWLHGEPEQGTAKQAPAFTPEQEERIAEIVRAALVQADLREQGEHAAIHAASRAAFEGMTKEDRAQQAETADPVREHFLHCYEKFNTPATLAPQPDTIQVHKKARIVLRPCVQRRGSASTRHPNNG